MEEQEAEDAERSDRGRIAAWLMEFALPMVGGVLLLAHVGLLLGTAADWPGMSYQSQRTWTRIHMLSMPFTLLFGFACLWIGELVRRQQTSESSYQGTHSKGWIPRTTNVRMLTVRWHAVWAGIAGAIAAVLIWLIRLNPDSDGWASAAIHGTLAAAIAGAFIASGFKKRTWLRSGEAKQRVLKDTFYLSPHRSRHLKRAKFWSWFSARFFVDIWCVGVGLAFWWCAALLAIAHGAFDEPLDGTTVAFFILAVPGLVLVVLGLWATTQFYRSGMDLETGEYLG